MPSLTFGTVRAGHGPGTGPVLAFAALLALGACAGHDRFADQRPAVDIYRTNMADYETDRRQCVSTTQRAEAK